MLAILLVAAALMEIDFIQAHPKNIKNADYSMFFQNIINDNIKVSSQKRYDREQEIERKRKLALKFRQMAPTKGKVVKRCPDEDDMDVVDRADHITQFLADMFVNTDDEITILQAAEPEENFFPSEVEDAFFNFLSRQTSNQQRVERPSDDLTR